MRTKATQHRLTHQNKHNNTPTTYKDNTFHKTTTTMRQAHHHHPTTNHQRHTHRHNHHYHFQPSLIRTTIESYPVALLSSVLLSDVACGYMGSTLNQNSTVWREPFLVTTRELTRTDTKLNYSRESTQFGPLTSR
jgi:hypothetical protein